MNDTKNIIKIDNDAFAKIPYGVYVLTSRDGDRDNGCIINTALQVTLVPPRISVCLNKHSFTHDMIKKSGVFNVTVLANDTLFDTVKRFGFVTGRETDKFAGVSVARTENRVAYLSDRATAVFSADVSASLDCGTHTIFVGDITLAKKLSDSDSLTYDEYSKSIKPSGNGTGKSGKVWVCKACGYEYDEDEECVPFNNLPDDWLCPVCRYPKTCFELKK